MAENDAVARRSQGLLQFAEGIVSTRDGLPLLHAASGLDQEADDATGRSHGRVDVTEQLVAQVAGHGMLGRFIDGFRKSEVREHTPDGAAAQPRQVLIDDVGAAEFERERGHVVPEQTVRQRAVCFLRVADDEESGGLADFARALVDGAVIRPGKRVEQRVGNRLHPVVVQVEHERRLGFHDGGKNAVRDTFAERTRAAAGKGPVEVFFRGRDVTGRRLETEGVHQRERVQRPPAQRRFAQALEDLLDDDHAADFVAVPARGQPHYRPGLRARGGHHGQPPPRQVGPRQNAQERVLDLLFPGNRLFSRVRHGASRFARR